MKHSWAGDTLPINVLWLVPHSYRKQTLQAKNYSQNIHFGTHSALLHQQIVFGPALHESRGLLKEAAEQVLLQHPAAFPALVVWLTASASQNLDAPSAPVPP